MKTKIITLILVIFYSISYAQDTVRATGNTTTTGSNSGGSGSGNGEYLYDLYPNPCTSSLTIKSRSNHRIVSYAIYDEKGKLIYNDNNSASQNVTQINEMGTQINLSAGKYYIRVMYDSGQTPVAESLPVIGGEYFIKADDQPLSIKKITTY